MIRSEMYHNVRVVPLDGRARTRVPQWMGEPRGRWDGNTLVIETESFDNKAAYWWATGWRASRPTLRLIERFTRVDRETLDYEFTMIDPATFTRPWTARFPLTTNQASRGVTEGPMTSTPATKGTTAWPTCCEGRGLEKNEIVGSHPATLKVRPQCSANCRTSITGAIASDRVALPPVRDWTAETAARQFRQAVGLRLRPPPP